MLYLAFIIGLFCVFLNEKSGKVNKTYFYVFVLSLFFIAIMRFGIGADYFAYDYLYNIMSSSDINNSFFLPKLNNPVKTLDLPIGGKGYSSQSPLLVFEYVNMVNNITDTNALAEDIDGNKIINFLKKCIRCSDFQL